MTTIFGWDASHFDKVPDGGRVVTEGFKFMTHKAGGDANDAELGAWWQEMKGYQDHLLLGAYWVLRRTDGLMAADAFLARLDGQCPGWRSGPFILQLDCEIWNDGAVPAPTKGQIKACADRLVAKTSGLRPIVYAPRWVYGDDLEGLKYPLWASSYVTGSGTASQLYPGDSSSRWGAYSGQTPAILQFTSSATIAGQTTCDANAFRGTLADLTALLAPGWTTKEETMNLTDTTGNKAYAGRTVEDFFGDFWKERDVLWGDANGTKIAALPPNSPLAQLLKMPAQLAALSASLLNLTPSAFADAVVAKLPSVTDPISQDEVTTAVKEAFAEAFGQHPTTGEAQ